MLLADDAANGQVAFVIDDLASTRPWRPRCAEIRGTGEAIAEPTDDVREFTINKRTVG